MLELRNRKGITIVMVAILMFVIIGVAAIAVDLGRMYVIKAELQTVADASATAAAKQLRMTQPPTPTTVALTYRDYNKVEKTGLAQMVASDVEACIYASPNPLNCTGVSWSSANAVRVTAHYTGAYGLARIFDATTQTQKAVAVAAVGYVGNSSCLRPWAVSYQKMLDNVWPPAGSRNAMTYNLTPQDILTLKSNTTPLKLLMDNSTTFSSGNLGQIDVGSGNGGNDYRDAITGNCLVSNLVIGPGTWIQREGGVGSGQSKNAVAELCGVTGSAAEFTCNKKVKLVVWDCFGNGTVCDPGVNGNNVWYRTKFVGVFNVTAYCSGAGNTSCKAQGEQVSGYFTTMLDEGGFSSSPTPIERPGSVLVQ